MEEGWKQVGVGYINPNISLGVVIEQLDGIFGPTP